MIIPVYFVRGVPILFVLCGFLAAKSIEKHTHEAINQCRYFRFRLPLPLAYEAGFDLWFLSVPHGLYEPGGAL